MSSRTATPWGAIALVGLGGLFAGVTGPLLSTFVPLLVRDVLGDRRTIIGGVMAIDNVLLLLLVPLAGLLSDRAVAAGRSRLPLVLGGFGLAAIGMTVFPLARAAGLAGIVAAIVVLYGGINLQRSPFQAFLADAIPSRYRSLATASVTFQMCVGAIVFLMLGRALGMRVAFVVSAATIGLIALALSRLATRATTHPDDPDAAPPSFTAVVLAAARGAAPGMRAVFAATFLIQLTFQTFTTWFALHGTERFGVSPADVTIGFIAWALGGVLGAWPAGVLGVRLGRRSTMVLGFGLMAASLLALDRVSSLNAALPLLMLASASWTVNAYPLFVEATRASQRGVLAGLYLLCMALGGAIGDPMNGRLFDAFGGYRPLFLMMALYSGLAMLTTLLVPHGAGEADTARVAPDAPPASILAVRPPVDA
jgi:maltose/moltooligosaccharide transporter